MVEVASRRPAGLSRPDGSAAGWGELLAARFPGSGSPCRAAEGHGGLVYPVSGEKRAANRAGPWWPGQGGVNLKARAGGGGSSAPGWVRLVGGAPPESHAETPRRVRVAEFRSDAARLGCRAAAPEGSQA